MPIEKRMSSVNQTTRLDLTYGHNPIVGGYRANNGKETKNSVVHQRKRGFHIID